MDAKKRALDYLELKKKNYKIQHIKDRAKYGEMEFSAQDDNFNRRTQQLIHYTNTKKYSQDLDISGECLKTLNIINGL